MNIRVRKPSCPFSTTQTKCVSLFSVSSTLFCSRAIHIFFIYLTSCFPLTSFHVIFFSLPLAMHGFFRKHILYPVSKQVRFMCTVTDGAGTGSTSSWDFWIPSHCFLKIWRGILSDWKAENHFQLLWIWVMLPTPACCAGNVFGRESFILLLAANSYFDPFVSPPPASLHATSQAISCSDRCPLPLSFFSTKQPQTNKD